MQVLKVLGILAAALVVLGVGGLAYIGAVGPEVKVVSGNQLRGSQLEKIRALRLLDAGESVRMFYSDGLVDIAEGMYFLTDKKLVLYSSEWEKPAVTIPLGEIAEVTATYSDSWLEDSTVWVALRDGAEHSFPLSMEGGGDKKFVSALKRAAGLTGEASRAEE